METKKSTAQLIAEAEMLEAGKGMQIIARHGDDTRVLGGKILASTKADWQAKGWKFFLVTSERARALLRNKHDATKKGTAPVAVSHKRGEACVEHLGNGRVKAKDGYVLVLRHKESGAVNKFVTADEALWRSRGWTMSVQYVGA